MGELPVVEGVRESVVNVLNSDAEPAGGIAVNHHRTLQPMHLLVGVYVAEFGNFLQPLHDDGRPVCEVAEIVRLKRVLIFSAAEPPPNAEVLPSLQSPHG